MMIQRAKMAAIGFCISALAVGSLAVNASLAQQPSPTTEPDKTIAASPAPLSPEAQTALDKGIVAAKLDPPDYPLALRYFEEARKHAPNAPAVFFHLGLAESKMPGRELRAICWFAAYLAAEPDASNAAAVKEQMLALDVKSESGLRQVIGLAQMIATRIPDNDNTQPDDRGWEQQAVVDLWCKVGDIATAQVVTDNIRGADNKCRAFESIAEAQHHCGDVLGARKSLLTAREAALRIAAEPIGGIQSSVYCSYTRLDRIAALQAEYGDISEGEHTANLLSDAPGDVKLMCYAGICETLALRTKNPAGAQGTIGRYLKELSSGIGAGKIGDDESVLHHSIIAVYQAKAGAVAEARATLAAARPYADRVNAVYARGGEISWRGVYTRIAVALAVIGDYQDAMTTIELEPVSGKRMSDLLEGKTDALVSIATLRLEAGDAEGARSTFESAKLAMGLVEKDSYRLSSLNKHCAIFMAKLGDYAGASHFVAQITDPFYKNSALRTIAETQADKRVPVATTDWLSVLDDGDEDNVCPLKTRPFLDLAGHLDALQNSNGVEIKKLSENLVHLSERMLEAREFTRLMLRRQGLAP